MDYTHVVEFEISRGGYSGVGSQDGADSEAEVLGTIKMGLFGYKVPGTVRNFCTFADGWSHSGNYYTIKGEFFETFPFFQFSVFSYSFFPEKWTKNLRVQILEVLRTFSVHFFNEHCIFTLLTFRKL